MPKIVKRFGAYADLPQASVAPFHLVDPFDIDNLTINKSLHSDANITIADGKTVDGCDLDRVANSLWSDYEILRSDGDAHLLRAFEESNLNYKIKIRLVWWKKTNAKAIVLKCQVNPGVGGGGLRLYVGARNSSVVIGGAGWQDETLVVDIDTMTCDYYEIQVQLHGDGADPATIQYVEILEVCNTSGTIC